MARYCCVSGCKGASVVDNIRSGLRFHRLPASQTVRDQWVRALQLKGALSNVRVCSGHFVDRDYFPTSIKTIKRRLKPCAVPTKALPLVKPTFLHATGIAQTRTSNSKIIRLASAVETPHNLSKNQGSPWRPILLPNVKGMAHLYVPKSKGHSSSVMRLISVENPPKTRSQRFNFFQDTMLLREVVSQNPFSSTLDKPWESIAAALNTYLPSMTGKSCKDRVLQLLKLHKANDEVSLQRWESQEQYKERKKLLWAVRDLAVKTGNYNEEEMPAKARQEMEDVQNVIMGQIQETKIMVSLTPQETVVNDYNRVASTSDIDIKNEHDSKREKKAALLRKQRAAEARLHEDELSFLKHQLKVEERKLNLEERKMELAAQLWNVEVVDRKEEKRMLMALIKMAMRK